MSHVFTYNRDNYSNLLIPIIVEIGSSVDYWIGPAGDPRAAVTLLIRAHASANGGRRIGKRPVQLYVSEEACSALHAAV